MQAISPRGMRYGHFSSIYANINLSIRLPVIRYVGLQRMQTWHTLGLQHGAYAFRSLLVFRSFTR